MALTAGIVGRQVCCVAGGATIVGDTPTAGAGEGGFKGPKTTSAVGGEETAVEGSGERREGWDQVLRQP